MVFLQKDSWRGRGDWEELYLVYISDILNQVYSTEQIHRSRSLHRQTLSIRPSLHTIYPSLLLRHISFPHSPSFLFRPSFPLPGPGTVSWRFRPGRPRDPSFTGRLSPTPPPSGGSRGIEPPWPFRDHVWRGLLSRVAGVIVPAPGAFGRRGRVPL